MNNYRPMYLLNLLQLLLLQSRGRYAYSVLSLRTTCLGMLNSISVRKKIATMTGTIFCLAVLLMPIAAKISFMHSSFHTCLSVWGNVGNDLQIYMGRTLLRFVRSILNDECVEFGADTFNTIGICCFKQYLSRCIVMRIHQIVYNNHLNFNLVSDVSQRKLRSTVSHKSSFIA